MLFKKIDLKLDTVDIERLKGQHFPFGTYFHEFAIDDTEYLTGILKNKIRFNIKPDRINITEVTYPGAHPHTDAWTVALNYYFETGSDETVFYTPKSDSIHRRHRHDKVNVYNLTDLDRIDAFRAEAGECFLFDTSVVHSVAVSKKDAVRKIMRATWLSGTVQDIFNSLEVL